MQLKKEEEVEVQVFINDKTITSFTLEIYFDLTKLEYIDKTENANFSQNRLIYTFVEDNAGQEAKQESKVIKFYFKSIGEGSASIVATGDFYNSNGEKVEIEDSSIELAIQNKDQEISTLNEENISEINVEEKEAVSSDNTDLKIMRIDQVGITPSFQKDIREYYFITDNSINDIEVTAVPENDGATVTITGNKNLKQGLNTIVIEVESKDKTEKSEYKIYVTKTQNPELSNANLENLALRDIILVPSFDESITNYELEVSKDTEKLDILAVPQKVNAKVEIKGNDGLKEGKNIIEIIVTAEDGITTKKYTLQTYKRNEAEEIEKEGEEKKQKEQLNVILEELQQEENNENREISEEDVKRNEFKYWIIIIFVIILIVGIILIKVLKKKK